MTDFKSKKVGILGLGEENLAVISYLKDKGAKITICDEKEDWGELKANLDKIKGRFELRLGPNYLDNLTDFDIVFRTPGLPYLNAKLQKAKEKGVEISSQIKLFFDLCPSPICGVTGTKGKGTTTSLIGEILEKSKFHTKNKKYINRVYVAGNIGRAPLEFVNDLEKNDWVILELSSFQLQDLTVSPHIAVILDIKSDHLDYHQNQTEYISAKTNIVKYQKRSDYAVINADYLTSFEFAALTSAQVYWFSRRKSVDEGAYLKNNEIVLRLEDKDYPIAKINKITLRGEHNLENICAAAAASALAGAPLKSIGEVVKNFRGLEHRLEFVAQSGGIKFYNDSFSTTPDTAIAAIKSFSEPIILIAGGSEKNADYGELGDIIANSSVKVAILIGKTGPRIKKKILAKAKKPDFKIIDSPQNLKEVMAAVKAEAKAGDVVLLTPASASFDWFSSYKDRGKQFKELVLKELS